jgi:hypothetical protein
VAEERAKASKPRVLEAGTKGGRALVLVPVLVAGLVGALVMPRSAVPEAVPLPMVDGAEIKRIVAQDRELAARARLEALPGEVRTLGSAIRDFNLLEARGGDDVEVAAARRALDDATLLALSKGLAFVVQLRALQLDGFLSAVKDFEGSGTESEELKALGGSFIRRMRFAGWCDESNHVLLDDTQRRAAFKATWSGLINLESRPELRLAHDETRALYALYIQHPHAPEAMRVQLETARKSARDARACAEIAQRETNAIEEWRLEKVRKLGQLDPTYPTAYAIGVVHFRRAQYPAATEAFRTWLQQHPSGPYALRARNYLKASIEAAAY